MQDKPHTIYTSPDRLRELARWLYAAGWKIEAELTKKGVRVEVGK